MNGVELALTSRMVVWLCGCGWGRGARRLRARAGSRDSRLVLVLVLVLVRFSRGRVTDDAVIL